MSSGQLFLWVSPSSYHDIMIMISRAHIIPPPSLQLDSQSSAWCLAVDTFICLRHLLDEDSMMAVRVVTNLITGIKVFLMDVFKLEFYKLSFAFSKYASAVCQK